MLILGGSSFLDEVTDPNKCAERVPKIHWELEGIADLRATGAFGKVNQGSAGKHMACIPPDVWAIAVQVEPMMAFDKKTFLAWLDRHPAYKVNA